MNDCEDNRRGSFPMGMRGSNRGPDEDGESIASSGSGVASGERQGYDYEFLPPLDKKFECPICLMCMREPVQTNCGHRFCETCIERWLRNKCERCPEDNLPLIGDGRYFHDVSTQREIFNLNVKCPNTLRGCRVVMELREVKEHRDQCPYSVRLCEMCDEELMLGEMDEHVQTVCTKRLVKCSHCSQSYRCDNEKAHTEICPEGLAKCQYCRKSLTRGKLDKHLKVECDVAELDCDFNPVGCGSKCTRESVSDHLSDHIISHLNLVRDFTLNSSHHLHHLASQVQSLTPCRCESSRPTSSHSYTVNTSSSPQLAIHLISPRPASFSLATNNDEYDEIAAAKRALHHPGTSSPSQTSPDDKVTSLEARLVLAEQKNRELELKLSRCDLSAKANRDLINQLESRLEMSAVNNNNHGVYMWRVKGLRALGESTPSSHVRSIHSPGFTTSPYGYRVCLRLNINGSTTPHSNFLSLFVHLLRGDNDDVLDWPFRGTVSLSVLDQVGDRAASSKAHITEKFESQPHLLAFQRPTSERNAKGFGYMEFIPYSLLEEGSRYIKGDTVVIKAEVREI